MTRAEYRAYLASREWAVLKEHVRARSGGRCERCREGDHEQTHHLTYERIGHEHLEDLLGVCEACHLFLSAKSDIDPLEDGGLPDAHKRIDWAGFVRCQCGTDRIIEVAYALDDRLRLDALCANGHRFRMAVVFSSVGQGLLVCFDA